MQYFKCALLLLRLASLKSDIATGKEEIGVMKASHQFLRFAPPPPPPHTGPLLSYSFHVQRYNLACVCRKHSTQRSCSDRKKSRRQLSIGDPMIHRCECASRILHTYVYIHMYHYIPRCTHLYIYMYIWGFPEIGAPLNHPF